MAEDLFLKEEKERDGERLWFAAVSRLREGDENCLERLDARSGEKVADWLPEWCLVLE